MIKASLRDTRSGKDLATAENTSGDPTLLTTTYGAAFGHFKSATRTSAGTTTVTSPLQGNSIALTDLLIATDKVNGATVTVQFSDGVNTVIIFKAHVTDAPCNIATSFSGGWAGWASAELQVVTTGAVETTVALGYYHIPEEYTNEFSEWDALRL